MKKSEKIRLKNKLKTVNNYHYLNYTKYASLLIVILFIIYFCVLSMIENVSYEELLSNNPIIITGFIICTANLYVWYIMKHFVEEIVNLEHIESIRLNMLVMAICQFFLMNFISVILMIISLIKYFKWDQFTFKEAILEIKKDGQFSVLVITTVVMLLMISLVFMIFFAVNGML